MWQLLNNAQTYCTAAQTQEAAGFTALLFCMARHADEENSLGALPQLYERDLHRILEEQSIFTQGIQPSQAALLELVGQGGKGSNKKEGSLEG